MVGSSPTPRKNAFEEMFDRPFTAPEAEEGIGPTLGEDLSVEHERAEDARNGAHDVEDSEEA